MSKSTLELCATTVSKDTGIEKSPTNVKTANAVTSFASFIRLSSFALSRLSATPTKYAKFLSHHRTIPLSGGFQIPTWDTSFLRALYGAYSACAVLMVVALSMGTAGPFCVSRDGSSLVCAGTIVQLVTGRNLTGMQCLANPLVPFPLAIPKPRRTRALNHFAGLTPVGVTSL